jgi:hypothetical protein
LKSLPPRRPRGRAASTGLPAIGASVVVTGKDHPWRGRCGKVIRHGRTFLGKEGAVVQLEGRTDTEFFVFSGDFELTGGTR